MARRVFVVVIDSFGVGAAPDAEAFGDAGTNTLRSVASDPDFRAPHLADLGLFNLDGIDFGLRAPSPLGAYARLRELSQGKDSTVGHWEIAGHVSTRPLPTFPEGFPADLIDRFERATGHKALCNLPYSGTQALHDYGEQAIAEDALIVYTSADSVFQVAAHEDHVPVAELYRYCEIARELCRGDYGVGRVIARPFLGQDADTFYRTPRRHDLSLEPPAETMLDVLRAAGKDVIGIGKINDLFAGKGLTESIKTTGNTNGIAFTRAMLTRDFDGLCFVNLVDTDMIYGHRRDIPGYARAVSEYDASLGYFLTHMRDDDILVVTADHGCDPGYTKTTDHTREYTPLLVCGKNVHPGCNLGTRDGFGTIAATVCDYLGVAHDGLSGTSVADEIFV